MTKVSNLFLQKKQIYGSKIREVSEENQQEYLTKNPAVLSKNVQPEEQFSGTVPWSVP